MSRKSLLLTSFNTWLPHQQSNSSDDLLQEIAKLTHTFPNVTFFRKLPVNIEIASDLVISKINEISPECIICCGMAEKRQYLSVESNASLVDEVIKTSVDLPELLDWNNNIKISDNAGKFVCEGLYYSVLKYLRDRKLNNPCIFVHVPLLNETNLGEIIADFQELIQRVRRL